MFGLTERNYLEHANTSRLCNFFLPTELGNQIKKQSIFTGTGKRYVKSLTYTVGIGHYGVLFVKGSRFRTNTYSTAGQAQGKNLEENMLMRKMLFSPCCRLVDQTRLP